MAKTTDTKVITGMVRLSFVHLLEPYAQKEGEAKKYSCLILIPKTDTETVAKIKKAIAAAHEAGRNDKLKGIKNPSNTFRDGDEEMDTEARPEYAGHYFMNLSSKQKPGILDRWKNPVTDPEHVYSGVYARVSMNFFAYNSNGGKGISAGLNNVQILKDGEPLGGKASANEDFDEYELDEEDDDLM